MPIVKLDATTSTNDFLSELARSQRLENFTVVTAEKQTHGRGQRGALWESETGKNLTMSVLVESIFANPESVFVLNAAVAVAIADTVTALGIDQVSIKWPNDILSGSKKISGVLIENTIRSKGEVSSIVGIGLNVNQTDFDELPTASSLASITGRSFDKDKILEKLLVNLRAMTENAEARSEFIWERYHQMLFKKDVAAAFEAKGKRFSGMIEGVEKDGRLRIRHENDSISHYGIREIKMLY